MKRRQFRKAIRNIEQVKVLVIDPGDTVVVNLRDQVTQEQALLVKEVVARITNSEVIVLGGGVSLTVVKEPQVTDERAELVRLRALVSWIDGACVDERPHMEIRAAINRYRDEVNK